MGTEARRNKDRQLQARIDAAGQGLDIRDRLGRPMLPGCVLAVSYPLPQLFVVEAVEPVLDPRAPAGLVRVTLTCQVAEGIMARVPWQPGIIVSDRFVGKTQEDLEALAATEARELRMADEQAQDPQPETERPSGVLAFPGQTPVAPGGIVLTDE